jgi:hypothetical protein
MACPGVRPRGAQPLRYYITWHGNPSSPWYEHEAALLERALNAAAVGAIDGIGVLKSGAEVVLRRPGIHVPTFPLFNFPVLPPVLPGLPTGGQEGSVVRIGIFGVGAHKNIATQVFAACSLEGVEVHVNTLPANVATAIAPTCSRSVVQHTRAPHDAFLRLLATMDVVSCEYRSRKMQLRLPTPSYPAL